MQGGELTKGWKMFYRRQRNAQLSGFIIGFATELAILSNEPYFDVAAKYALILLGIFGLVVLWAFMKQGPFVQGAFVSAAFVSILLLSNDIRPMVQAFFAWPLWGAFEIMMFIVAGLLLVRS